MRMSCEPSPYSVLIADDDVDLLRALSLGCSALGYDVVTAPDGGEALRMAQSAPPHLMIVDIGMPCADGFQVCDSLLESGVVFPVIALTGRADAMTSQRCESLGMHFVKKGAESWDRLVPLMHRLITGYWSN